MLKNATLFLLLFCNSISIAQVQKGSWLIRAQNDFEFRSVKQVSPSPNFNTTSLSFNNSAGYFITSGTVFGTGLHFSFATDFIEDIFLGEDFNLFRYSVPIFYRQYLNPGKTRWFTHLQFNFSRIEIKSNGEEFFKDDYTYFDLGFGFDYFLTKDVAVEGSLNYRVGDSEEFWLFRGTDLKWHYNLNIQLFLNRSEKSTYETGEQLPNQYLKKGNAIFSGAWWGRLFKKDYEEPRLEMDLGFRYFLKDRIELGTRLGYQKFFQFNELESNSEEIAAHLTYYHPIFNTFFLAPGFKLGYSHSKQTFQSFISPSTIGTIDWHQHNFLFGPSVAFLFFPSSKNLLKTTLSTEFQNGKQHEVIEGEKSDPTFRIIAMNANWQIAWQHFVFKNMAVEIYAQYNILESENRLLVLETISNNYVSRIQAGLGFSYFISKKSNDQ